VVVDRCAVDLGGLHDVLERDSGIAVLGEESAFYDPSNFAFSNGVHVCELEVDPETGTTEILAYHAVDDVGTVINPMICVCFCDLCSLGTTAEFSLARLAQRLCDPPNRPA
jgi:hypothetical protein